MSLDALGCIAKVELTLRTYDVLESGDPACPHLHLWTDATETQRCACGRTVVLASERTVIESASE